MRIPYEMNGETKAMYPDFIVLRKNVDGGEDFIIDVLEPHWGEQDDNLPKAKALAQYAAENANIVERVELIRKIKDRLVRLNLANVRLRAEVLKMTSKQELDKLFEEAAGG